MTQDDTIRRFIGQQTHPMMWLDRQMVFHRHMQRCAEFAVRGKVLLGSDPIVGVVHVAYRIHVDEAGRPLHETGRIDGPEAPTDREAGLHLAAGRGLAHEGQEVVRQRQRLQGFQIHTYPHRCGVDLGAFSGGNGRAAFGPM